jgi:integrase
MSTASSSLNRVNARLGEWLDEWLEKAIKPPAKRLRTWETYQSVIERYLKPAFGLMPLQQLKSLDLETHYKKVAENGLAQASVQQHHIILHSCLQAAVLDGLVVRNVAKLVKGKPKAPEGQPDAHTHCWDSHEAKRFLAAAKEAGPQPAAFYATALDSGARKAELCGLPWSDVDFKAVTITIRQQLVKPGPEPLFGLPKNGQPRVIDLSPETMVLLRKHHAHQAELKMANRLHYHDHGLVFAKEWPDLRRQRDTLGDPLQMNNLGQREYARL